MKRMLIIGCLSILFFGCCKEEPIVPVPKTWDKFTGTYNVTKLESGETYSLTISFDTVYSEISGAEQFSIIYENFDDSFDTLSGWYPNGTSIDNLNIEQFNAPFGVMDYNNKRWATWIISQDTMTTELENTLINDTILFYFRKSNVAFYTEDEIEYFDCYCKHLAVKVN